MNITIGVPEIMVAGGIALIGLGQVIPGWSLVFAGAAGSFLRLAYITQERKSQAESLTKALETLGSKFADRGPALNLSNFIRNKNESVN
jgi:hypothetical protein